MCDDIKTVTHTEHCNGVNPVLNVKHTASRMSWLRMASRKCASSAAGSYVESRGLTCGLLFRKSYGPAKVRKLNILRIINLDNSNHLVNEHSIRFFPNNQTIDFQYLYGHQVK